MDFSLVIPVLNEEKRLPKCLTAIKNLDYPKDKYEVLIIDNGSTDRSVDIIKSYGFNVYSEPKKGITFAREKGLNLAKGKYYITTDADAIVPRDWLKNAKKAFKKDKNIVGITGTIEAHDLSKIDNNFCKVAVLTSSKLRNGFLHGCNMAVKTTIARKAGGFLLRDYKFYEDAILTVRVKKYGKVYYDPNFRNVISFRRYKGLGVFNAVTGVANYYSIKYANVILSDILDELD